MILKRTPSTAERWTHAAGAARRGSRAAWIATAVVLGCAAGICAASRFRDVPDNHWARAAIETSVDRKLMSAPGDVFQPDRAVTRAELAVVLVRMIDAVEKSGPKPFDRSPAKHDVPAAQLAAARKLPASHWATPAVRRLVEGGYLSPIPAPHDGPGRSQGWMPTAGNLDQPVSAAEVASATTSVVTRVEEKKVAVLHPEALKQGDRPETRGME